MSNFTGNRRWLRRRTEPSRPLFDPPRRSPPASRSSVTSQAAAHSVEHAVAYIEDRILDWLRDRGDQGATAEETATALELRAATTSARISEMSHSGQILDSGRTRPTSSGRAAVVWIHPHFRSGGAACEA